MLLLGIYTRVIQHKHLQNIISNGQKFRELQRIKRNHNFQIIIDSFEHYARPWNKREDVQLLTLSE